MLQSLCPLLFTFMSKDNSVKEPPEEFERFPWPIDFKTDGYPPNSYRVLMNLGIELAFDRKIDERNPFTDNTIFESILNAAKHCLKIRFNEPETNFLDLKD